MEGGGGGSYRLGQGLEGGNRMRRLEVRLGAKGREREEFIYTGGGCDNGALSWLQFMYREEDLR